MGRNGISFRLLGEAGSVQVTSVLAIMVYPIAANVFATKPGVHSSFNVFPPGRYHSISRVRDIVLPPLQYAAFYFNILFWLLFWRHHGRKRQKSVIVIASAIFSLSLGIVDLLLIKQLRKLPFPLKDLDMERDYKIRQLRDYRQVAISKTVVAVAVLGSELATIIYALCIASSVRRYPKRFEPTSSRKYTRSDNRCQEVHAESVNSGKILQAFELQRSLKHDISVRLIFQVIR